MRSFLRTLFLLDAIGAAMGALGAMVVWIVFPVVVLGLFLAPVLVLYTVEHITNANNQALGIIIWTFSWLLNGIIWAVLYSRDLGRRPPPQHGAGRKLFWVALYAIELVSVQMGFLIPMPPHTR